MNKRGHTVLIIPQINPSSLKKRFLKISNNLVFETNWEKLDKESYSDLSKFLLRIFGIKIPDRESLTFLKDFPIKLPPLNAETLTPKGELPVSTDEIKLFSNILDRSNLENVMENIIFLEKKNIILNVGRLVEQKNQLELIEIFSKCNYKNWVLKIYGSGHLKEEIKNKIIELNLQKHVELNEFTQNIDAVFGQAKIFALPSLYEGFPNALIEAMAHGLPSISYDCHTGPKDIIEDNTNGLLVPLSNKKVFVEKLNSLMGDEHQRMLLSTEAKKVNEIYSLNKISREYYNFVTK